MMKLIFGGNWELFRGKLLVEKNSEQSRNQNFDSNMCKTLL